MRNVLKVVLVIIGTLIGAGFISGQEMYRFFYIYGIKGVLGLIFCSITISFIIYKTFIIVKEYNIKDYKSFLAILSNKSKNSYFNFAYITNIIINTFIFITFCIMVSGFGAYFSQEIHINSLIGSIIFAVITFIVLMKDIKGIVKLNELLVPIIIIFVLIIGICNFENINSFSTQKIELNDSKIGWLISSTLYSSYNIILLIPVLITLRKYIDTKKSITRISLISSIIILITSIILFSILTKIEVDINTIEMPIAYAISEYLPYFSKIYGVIILISIFTTTILLGISFLKNVSQNKKSYTQIAAIMCITSVILSNIGFSNLINLLYPIFGILGLVQIKKIIFYKLY